MEKILSFFQKGFKVKEMTGDISLFKGGEGYERLLPVSFSTNRNFRKSGFVLWKCLHSNSPRLLCSEGMTLNALDYLSKAHLRTVICKQVESESISNLLYDLLKNLRRNLSTPVQQKQTCVCTKYCLMACNVNWGFRGTESITRINIWTCF